jgi:hypothetical protein
MKGKTMTNKDKALLARCLMHQAGNLLEVYQDHSGYWDEIEHLDYEDVKAQLALWMKALPGNKWDTRL